MARAKRGTDHPAQNGMKYDDAMVHALMAKASAAALIEAGPIDLRLEGKYILARHGDTATAYRIVWEHDHGENRQRLTLRQCETIPRELEPLVYRR